jgi:hypothetical protein
MKRGTNLLWGALMGVAALTVTATPAVAAQTIPDPSVPYMYVYTYTNWDFNNPLIYGQRTFGCPDRPPAHWGEVGTGHVSTALVRCDYPEIPNPQQDSFFQVPDAAPSVCPTWVTCTPWPDPDPNKVWVNDI